MVDNISKNVLKSDDVLPEVQEEAKVIQTVPEETKEA